MNMYNKPILSIFIVLFIFINGCKNDDDYPLFKDYQMRKFIYPGVSNVNGVLHFQDRATLEAIYDSLDAHQFDGITSYHDSLCVGGTYPFLDSFEMALNFTSLRRHYEALNCAELDNSVQPENLSDHHIIDDVMATLIGVSYRVVISDTLFYWKGKDLIYYSDASDAEDRMDLVESGMTYTEAGVTNHIVQKLGKTGNCLPNFTFNVDHNSNTISVTYTGTPVNPTRLVWSFNGAGNLNLNQKQVVFQAPSAGNYQVCVTIMDDNGTPGDLTDDCEGTNCKEIEVGGDCTADFDFTVGVNGQVNFVDKSHVQFGTITSWHWTFGDGETSNLRNPTHTYDCDKIYDVTLTINGSACSGSQSTKLRKVEVTTFNCCDRNPDDKGPESYNGGNNRILWEYDLGSDLIWDQRFKARQRNYVKKSNGNWKKQRFNGMAIDFYEHLYKKDQNDCLCALEEDIQPDHAGWHNVKNLVVKDKLAGIKFNRALNWFKLNENDPVIIDYKLNPYTIKQINTRYNGLECE